VAILERFVRPANKPPTVPETPLIELRAGSATATIDPERGGRLASLRVGDRELLVGPPDATDRSIHWGSFLMAPWPGRLADGRLQFRGRTWQLRKTHGRHAIHGLVWGRAWEVECAEASGAELHVALAGDGWPFGGEVRQSLRLEAHALTLDAEVRAGDLAMPAALGWHPWIRRDAVGGEPSLLVDAGKVLERRRMLPTGRELPVARRTDLRGRPALGRRRLDDAYLGASSPAFLLGVDMELRVSFDAACDTVVVYTPWNAVCIEPQSAWPNALGLPDQEARLAGRRDLEPGEALRARMTLSWS
jgi:aldose 1-epimerase